MHKVYLPSGELFLCNEDDTLVQGALRQGVGLPYECNSGGCGTCKFILEEGKVEELNPDAAGLSDRDKRKGRKLACQCRPMSDLKIKVSPDPLYTPLHKPTIQQAKLVSIETLTHNIRAFKFKPDTPMDFLPGQYTLLTLPEGDVRAYSMANLADDQSGVEFFIKQVPGGHVTQALFDIRYDTDTDTDTEVSLDGPYGIAYCRTSPRDIICVAGGSGLAPMISIARAHVQAGIKRKLYFFFGGQRHEDILKLDQFRRLVGDSTGVIQYTAAVSDETSSGSADNGFVHQVMLERMGQQLSEYDIYCAGPPAMTTALESTLHTIGFPMGQLYYDRFF